MTTNWTDLETVRGPIGSHKAGSPALVKMIAQLSDDGQKIRLKAGVNGEESAEWTEIALDANGRAQKQADHLSRATHVRETHVREIPVAGQEESIFVAPRFDARSRRLGVQLSERPNGKWQSEPHGQILVFTLPEQEMARGSCAAR